MPELPEVETTRRGLEPHVTGRRVHRVEIRDSRLRWPIPDTLAVTVTGSLITGIRRRAKYLIIDLQRPGGGYAGLIVHLGMSGSLRICPASTPVKKHDHVDIVLEDRAHPQGEAMIMRYNDPRRFGSWHLLGPTNTAEEEASHWLLKALGPEPLSDAFDGAYLYRRSKGVRTAVKSFLMNQDIVVGVGNIYANEALFQAGILPTRKAGLISAVRYDRLAEAIKFRLQQSIEQGGTTLRDFVGGDGKPGYFQQSLQVYGRGGLACPGCAAILHDIRLNQRTTVYCKHCQR
ncbi:bifunctional DNA-formamidopyrimidine glycosylase/DNA-(apurinic or apyrimidinic site) lyase [Allohahella marinimesophila]|uniref:Formamidopyrimidine-DNA glycosylase n=1 Tax=Allohahella marinimesophila TaxID=1054972 RepID=A0ABP7PHT2_9GAMM